MIILAIDPGIRGVGAAVFHRLHWQAEAKLIACAYIANPRDVGNGPVECLALGEAVQRWWLTSPVNVLAVEWPQTYGGRADKGDTNDLLPLIGVNIAIASRFPGAEVLHFRPHEWKGSIPKGKDNGVIESRIRARLDAQETLVLDSLECVKKLRHNVIDAIGIGLNAVGRFDRKRVFPRE